MSVKVGINGFGRIGRQVFKIIHERFADEIEVVAVNDLTDDETLAHLLKYDTVYGKFPGTVSHGDATIIVDGKEIPSSAQPDPSEMNWDKLGADVVLESTGFFRDSDGARKHIKDGKAKKVLISAPAKDKADDLCTVVLGVNDEVYDPGKHNLVSNASCTTNSLAPLCKVLDESFGIKSGIMTTIHSYTTTQNILDGPHKDLRRARAAAENILPTSTGAADAIGIVLPDLDGKLTGIAVRVPTPTGSLTDLVVDVDKETNADKVRAAFKEAAEGDLKGYLDYCTEPIVQADIVGDPHSCIFDAEYCRVMNGNLVKVLGWYDNEWGYATRTAELLKKLGESL
ncbi:MAG: type I glyceraldehyde-3-phosphate dehydrogenase [Armatimonadota bacterium]